MAVCSIWSVLETEEDWSVTCHILLGERKGGGATQPDVEGASGGGAEQRHKPVHLPYRVIM